MSGREAWAIVGPDGAYIAVHFGDRDQTRFSDAFLERRGLRVQEVRILATGELDDGTLKRAAKAQCSGCATDVPINDAGYHQQGSFTFPCHAAAIRSLTPGATDKKPE